MCELSINNMLWLPLKSVVQNKHLPMLESPHYAVRHSQSLCSSCQQLYHGVFFNASGFKNDPIFREISKPIMDIFLQILDENWLDDKLGRLL